MEALRGCCEARDWQLVFDSCSDDNELTETATAYIRFSVVQPKMIKLLVNNKPRISKDLAACLVAKKHAFIEGGMEKVLDVNKTKQKSTEKLASEN